ncbi:hypothetical protein VPH35_130271 [Triticum aestivum]
MDTAGCKTLHPTSPPFDFFLATRRAVSKRVRVQLAVADAVRCPGQVMLLVCSPLTNKKTREHRCCSLLFLYCEERFSAIRPTGVVKNSQRRRAVRQKQIHRWCGHCISPASH